MASRSDEDAIGAPAERGGDLFVAWTRYMRRPESMQDFFAYRLCFLPGASSGRLNKAFTYVKNSLATACLMLRHRPRVLWLQLAPVFPLYIAFLLRPLTPGSKLIADCHNSMFGPRWIGFPGSVRLLNRCDVVLVHNEHVYAAALRAGVDRAKLHVLETRPARLDCRQIDFADVEARYPEPWVLVPTSFSRDEPIESLVAAARLAPGVTFVVTGDPARAAGLHDLSALPPNLCLTGFLDRDEFNRHICAAPLMMGLTTREDIQLSVANEAAGAGKPMVISDTALLRTLFDSGAVYVKATDPRSIAEGVRLAWSMREELARGAIALRERRTQRWLEQAETIVQRLA